jgi:hypothetical protein
MTHLRTCDKEQNGGKGGVQLLVSITPCKLDMYPLPSLSSGFLGESSTREGPDWESFLDLLNQHQPFRQSLWGL